MGGGYSIPPKIKAMPPTDKAPQLDIQYCAGWGGYNEAAYVQKVIKHVYPQAKLRTYSPGYMNNTQVLTQNGDVLFDRNKNGLNERSMIQLVDNIGKSSEWKQNS